MYQNEFFYILSLRVQEAIEMPVGKCLLLYYDAFYSHGALCAAILDGTIKSNQSQMDMLNPSWCMKGLYFVTLHWQQRIRLCLYNDWPLTCMWWRGSFHSMRWSLITIDGKWSLKEKSSCNMCNNFLFFVFSKDEVPHLRFFIWVRSIKRTEMEPHKRVSQIYVITQ